jgi:uncharacterized phage infection (PIP) family protein YhgE
MEEILYQNYLEFNIYIIILNVLLFLSAKKIFSIFNFREKSLNLFLFKLVNVGFIVLTLLDKVFDQNTLLFFDIISTLLIIYVAILTQVKPVSVVCAVLRGLVGGGYSCFDKSEMHGIAEQPGKAGHRG